jgi:Tfp pilus assembly major pilin PilA
MKKHNLVINGLTNFFVSFSGLNKISVSEKEALHILKIGEDKQFMQSFLSLIELLGVVLIISCLLVIAIPIYKNYIEKAKNSKTIVEISKLKMDASIYYAEHGIWPQPLIDKTEIGLNYQSLQLAANGQIIAIRKDQTQQLSFTPFISKNKDGVENDIVLWLCGYAKAPPSYSTTTLVSSTTIPTTHLPRVCVY